MVITEVHGYYNIPVSSFDYIGCILGVFVPLFIRPSLQEPMYIYNVRTLPVPYHINAAMVDETENENAYIHIIPDTEMVAMNRDTYINVDQSELKQCIKFSVMYFCEQCKVLLPVSSLVVHKIYCATLGNVARVYPWIIQGLTFLSA